MKAKISTAFFCVLFVFLLSACGNDSKKQEQPQPITNSNDEIVLASYRQLAPGNREAYFCSKILYVWEPLITVDKSGHPLPCLAESWQSSEDAKKWTFHLKRNVRFHDGTPFNADTVLANLDRIRGKLRRSGYFPMDHRLFYPGLSSYYKVDEYTVCMEFDRPSISQPYRMTDFASPMFNPNSLNADGDFINDHIGTGPFKVVDRKDFEYVVLQRNEDYHGEKAKAEKIRIVSIPDVTVRYSALLAGEIMGVIDLNAITPVQAQELSQNSAFSVSANKSMSVSFLALNGSKFPFNDVRMRQAVSLALDRKQITEGLFCGFAKPTVNLLNYTSSFYKELPIQEDLLAAKQLAGEVLGNSRATVIYCIIGDKGETKSEAELIAYWLDKIGLDVQIKTYELGSLSRALKKGHFDLVKFGQALIIPDASYMFDRYLSPEGDRNKHYKLCFDNDLVNKLMQQAESATSIEQKRLCYEQIQETAASELPLVPISDSMVIVAYSKRLADYEARTYGIDLPKVRWADAQ